MMGLPNPKNYAFREKRNPKVYKKFVDDEGWEYYAMAYDKETGRYYGLVKGDYEELGFFFPEGKAEQDFEPKPASEIE